MRMLTGNCPRPLLLSLACLMTLLPRARADAPAVSYERDVAPLLRQYCAGCHNEAEREGGFSLETYDDLMHGLEAGPAVLPGDAAGSRLWRVVSGESEPHMPPAGEPAPNAEQLALLSRWIDQGAGGPAGAQPDRLTLRVPQIASRAGRSPVTSLAFSPDGNTLAIGRFGEVSLVALDGKRAGSESARIAGLPGKAMSVRFRQNGTQLLTASGVAGSGGIATLWDARTGARMRDFLGHRDQLSCAELSPDESLLATCSYDRQVILWDAESGEPLRTLSGHNGAVSSVAFSPDGGALASASADDTCKLWRVRDGARLDTLSQPLKEVASVLFTPDARQVIAGGADNRIRVWKFVSRERPRINPQLLARFAHEAPIVQLALSPDGSRLISAAEDRSIKIWETRSFTELQAIEGQPDVAAALAIAPTGDRFAVGRLDGSWDVLPLDAPPRSRKSRPASPSESGAAKNAQAEVTEVAEVEPNDQPQAAQPIALPARVSGIIHAEQGTPDQDCFRFSARAGEEWVFEVDAARSNSPLDSFIEILTPEGAPIERVRLQAVLDSYFTFRGKDGEQANDFRLFNWEEMELNQLLYANGEVVKLWRAPRGPDSGFDVYSASRQRWTYFDTMSLAHALNEPCYIVEPHAPDEELIPNGLPVFTVYYENDDDSRRELGKDSKLFFTAPRDGEYVVRIRDVRGMQGADFRYTLVARERREDFSASTRARDLTLVPGAAADIKFQVSRVDQFAGPVSLTLSGLPKGVRLFAPVLVESEQTEAYGVITVDEGTPLPSAEDVRKITLRAEGEIRGEMVRRSSKPFKSAAYQEAPPLPAAILPAEGGAVPVGGGEGAPLEFEIHPGETIQVRVVVDRENADGEINFADNNSEEAGRNVPHGVIVDNLGLNGLMIPDGAREQRVFLTAAKGVPEQSRAIHLKLRGSAQATPPVILHVRPPGDSASGRR